MSACLPSKRDEYIQGHVSDREGSLHCGAGVQQPIPCNSPCGRHVRRGGMPRCEEIHQSRGQSKLDNLVDNYPS
eukprot:scaffold34602_cov216-Amphora_coffeaeformis.AAC.2